MLLRVHGVGLPSIMKTFIFLLFPRKSVTLQPDAINEKHKIKVKVKFTLELATMSQRGSRGIALLFL
jgi:hypothetical protein